MGHRWRSLCKLSCLIIGDQRCPPLAHPYPLALGGDPLLFARCVAIGEVVSLPTIFVIYAELNRHGIARKHLPGDTFPTRRTGEA